MKDLKGFGKMLFGFTLSIACIIAAQWIIDIGYGPPHKNVEIYIHPYLIQLTPEKVLGILIGIFVLFVLGLALAIRGHYQSSD